MSREHQQGNDQRKVITKRVFNTSNRLPRGWRKADIKKIAEFVRISEGIPQLARARVHGILLLANLTSSGLDIECLPELGPEDIEIVLRASDRFDPRPVEKQGPVPEAA